MVEALAFELRWPHKSLGWTTFRREDKGAGAEPDECWRHTSKGLAVRLLTDEGVYVDSPISRAFPFLLMERFASFIPRVIEEDETVVLLEFSAWIRTLPRS